MKPTESDVRRAVANIMHYGLVWIESNAENPIAVQKEAYHLHNLPALLNSFSRDLLEYYWEVERKSYLKKVNPVSRLYENEWKIIEQFLAA